MNGNKVNLRNKKRKEKYKKEKENGLDDCMQQNCYMQQIEKRKLNAGCLALWARA